MLIDAVISDDDGRVREIQVKQRNPDSHWVWGAFKLSGKILRELSDLWRQREGRDAYVGTLVNAWLRDGAWHKRRYNSARLNVLIHAEEIVGIVFLFDRGQPFVIPAVGFLHAFLAFIAHQEVHICSTCGKRMHRVVIALRP